MGRASTYGEEVVREICEALANGQSLREWCEGSNRPHIATVMRWVAKHDEFREQYARAREAQMEFYSDEIMAIADNAENDWMKRQGKEDEEYWVANGEHIQRSRLRIDSRKWLMSKLAAKKYGDKVDHTHGGPPDGEGRPRAIEVTFVGSNPKG